MGAALATFAASSLCECAACCGLTLCSALLNWTMSQARRFSHFLIVLTTISLAVVLGKCYVNELQQYQSISKLNLTNGCADDFLSECIYRQLVYRASLSCVLLFSFLGVASWFTSLVDKSFWPLKFIFAYSVFAALLWSNNADVSAFAELARVLSFFWLLVQNLLVLELGYGIHDRIMQAAADEEAKTNGDSRGWLALYLVLSVLLLVCAVVGVVYLFQDYSNCETGKTFTVLVLVVGLVTTLVSLLQVVNKGLLTPSVMFAYSVQMTWYALLSSSSLGCNPSAALGSSPEKDAAIATVLTFSTTLLTFGVCWGSRILSIFNPQGQALLSSSSEGDDARRRDLEVILVSGQSKVGVKAAKLPYTTRGEENEGGAGAEDGEEEGAVQESKDTPHERVFFHSLMALSSAFFAMVLTSWGKTDGSPEIKSGDESMWLKIVSVWLFMALFAKSLHAAYVSNN